MLITKVCLYERLFYVLLVCNITNENVILKILTWFDVDIYVQTPRVHHCLHMRNSNSDLDYLSIFRCKHSQLPDAQCHVNMACNQWLETWDVAITHTGGTRICVTVQWMSVDCMTLSLAKLDLIWTVTGNSRVITGESQTQSWSIASVHPLHYFVAKAHSYLTVYDR